MNRITEQQYVEAAEQLRSAGLTDELKELHSLYTSQAANQPVDYKFSETAKNFPSSLGRALGQYVTPFLSPIDTATNTGRLIKSAGYNLAQEVKDLYDPNGKRLPNQEMGEAVAGMLADRYGSVDALKKTAMEDPAGLLLDASSILTMGGGLAAKAPGLAGTAGQQVQKAGAAIDPITGIVKAPAAAIEAYSGRPVSEMLYESAMKPSTILSPEKRKELIKTGVQLGATPTQDSVKKIQGQRQQLLDEVLDIELQSKATDVVDPQGLFKYIDGVRAEHAPPIIDAMDDLNAIDGVVDKMQDSIFMNGGNPLSVQDLARIKRDIYKKVDYDKERKRGAYDLPTDKARKQIARAAKEAIEEIVPEVKQKNQLWGAMKDFQENLHIPASNRISNRDIIGLGLPAAAGAGQVMAGNAGGVLATTLGILDRPVTKSRLAIGTNRLGKAVRSPVAPLVSASNVNMGRLTQAMEEEEKKKKRKKQ
nr:hypothetical protein [uncultured Mediterranean phage uvMED]